MFLFFFFIVEDPPTLDELEQITGSDSKVVRVIDTVAPKWEEVAIALGFDGPAIDRMRRDYATDCREACSQMLQKWLRMDYVDICKPISWDVFVQSLQDAEFSCLADELSAILDN